MSGDILKDDSEWVCNHCGSRFFKEGDARTHVYLRHQRKKTTKAGRSSRMK